MIPSETHMLFFHLPPCSAVRGVRKHIQNVLFTPRASCWSPLCICTKDLRRILMLLPWTYSYRAAQVLLLKDGTTSWKAWQELKKGGEGGVFPCCSRVLQMKSQFSLKLLVHLTLQSIYSIFNIEFDKNDLFTLSHKSVSVNWACQSYFFSTMPGAAFSTPVHLAGLG